MSSRYTRGGVPGTVLTTTPERMVRSLRAALGTDQGTMHLTRGKWSA